jgi:GNAT superfamily N-acetyltransferase
MAEFEPLSAKHSRQEFDCGNDDLNAYLKHYARQDQKRGAAQTWVLTDPQFPLRVDVYYTLSAHSIQSVALRFPYQSIPALLIGRLAVTQRAQGKSLGKIAIVDALLRAQKIGTEVGIRFLLVLPKNQKVEAFYSKLGFQKLPDSKLWYFDLKQLKT